MIVNAAAAGSLSQQLQELGSIPADRVHLSPQPGTATLADWQSARDQGVLCELVDATIVEKAMGYQESVIAMVLGGLLGNFVRHHNLGIVSGPDGFIRLLASMVRGPDVAFISWDRLPGRQFPTAAVPEIVPDLAVEVLSTGNTFGEMSRKRREYFHAGVRLVWMIDPRERTVAVYTSITDLQLLDEQGTLDGGEVLPGLNISLSELFGELDRQAPSQDSVT